MRYLSATSILHLLMLYYYVVLRLFELLHSVLHPLRLLQGKVQLILHGLDEHARFGGLALGLVPSGLVLAIPFNFLEEPIIFGPEPAILVGDFGGLELRDLRLPPNGLAVQGGLSQLASELVCFLCGLLFEFTYQPIQLHYFVVFVLQVPLEAALLGLPNRPSVLVLVLELVVLQGQFSQGLLQVPQAGQLRFLLRALLAQLGVADLQEVQGLLGRPQLLLEVLVLFQVGPQRFVELGQLHLLLGLLLGDSLGFVGHPGLGGLRRLQVLLELLDLGLLLVDLLLHFVLGVLVFVQLGLFVLETVLELENLGLPLGEPLIDLLDEVPLVGDS